MVIPLANGRKGSGGMKPNFNNLITAFAWLLLLVSPVLADDTATLTWTPNTGIDVAGYKIYQSTVSGEYGAPVAVIGNVSEYVTTIKTENDQRYYFTITAFDKAGNESAKSEEVSKLIVGTKVMAGIGSTHR
jgi:fibronectin type 3 domain-containing protein